MISFLILPMQRVTRLPLLMDVSTGHRSIATLWPFMSVLSLSSPIFKGGLSLGGAGQLPGCDLLWHVCETLSPCPHKGCPLYFMIIYHGHKELLCF